MKILGRTSLVCATVAATLCASAGAARAGETKGKFRFSPQYSYYTISDEIRSNADNVSTSRSSLTGLVEVFADPRPDRAAEKSATISDGDAYGFNVGFGILAWKWGELLIDGNYNHFQSKIANLEITASFVLPDPMPDPINGPLPSIHTPMRAYPTTVGSLSWENPQVGALVRFRPTKAFVPYLGAGVGRYFVDFERSKDIDFFSKNLEQSQGSWLRYDPDTLKQFGRPTGPLHGIEVEADDASEYHLSGGVEYNFQGKARHWSIYLDTRYMITDGQAKITTTGLTDFGQATPDGQLPDDFPAGGGFGVTILPGDGGLFDFGSAFHDPNSPGTLKKGPPDGLLDPGTLFVEGGTIKYGGFLFSLGVRYTF